jgi:hypothetical protein
MWAALFLLAGQATTCTTTGNITRCVDAKPPLDNQALLQRGMAMVPQYQRPDRQQQVRTRVANFIRSGRCDDAKNVALEIGDLDLAEQSQRLCTPAAK